MTITAHSKNLSNRLSEGKAVSFTVPKSADFETIFRRLMYEYGQVIDTEKLNANTKRYTFLTKMQYRDTLENYQLETFVTVER